MDVVSTLTPSAVLHFVVTCREKEPFLKLKALPTSKNESKSLLRSIVENSDSFHEKIEGNVLFARVGGISRQAIWKYFLNFKIFVRGWEFFVFVFFRFFLIFQVSPRTVGVFALSYWSSFCSQIIYTLKG